MGDEVFPAIFDIEGKDRIPVRAICHVMDVSDLKHPREVAQYEVPEGGSHNFWAANDMLFEGYYSGGARVLDISGGPARRPLPSGSRIARFWTGDAMGVSLESAVHLGRAALLRHLWAPAPIA